jgi:hypothetical protein
MQDALIALGRVGATEFVPHIVQRLNELNSLPPNDEETKRRYQRAAIGCIEALSALQDAAGFKPVFFASIGWYDAAVQNMASVALPNIEEDPGATIAEIIMDASVPPDAKYASWREMLRSRASNESKARVALTALNAGWHFQSNLPGAQRHLREMRISAIDAIRTMGLADDSDTVYTDLERSYRANFVSNTPDYEEIRRTIACLSSMQSEQSVGLLEGFLRELHGRRRVGPWDNKERQVFSWILPAIGSSGTQSMNIVLLLRNIERSNDYTGTEQRWARDALRSLGH